MKTQTPSLEGFGAKLDLPMRLVHLNLNIIRFGITVFWGFSNQKHRSLSNLFVPQMLDKFCDPPKRQSTSNQWPLRCLARSYGYIVRPGKMPQFFFFNAGIPSFEEGRWAKSIHQETSDEPILHSTQIWLLTMVKGRRDANEGTIDIDPVRVSYLIYSSKELMKTAEVFSCAIARCWQEIWFVFVTSKMTWDLWALKLMVKRSG